VLTYEELCAAHDAAIDALEHQQQIVHALAQQRTQYEAAQVTARMKPDATATKRFLELTR
jgi:hypothetical protein